jgi:hypothetical protein
MPDMHPRVPPLQLKTPCKRNPTHEQLQIDLKSIGLSLTIHPGTIEILSMQ